MATPDVIHSQHVSHCRVLSLPFWLAVAALLTLPADAADPPADSFEWLRHARVFILDAYTYPLAPRIELDAQKLAEAMVDMHADTLRVATSGNYWLIPGTQFGTAPDLGERDILSECVAACAPRGIRVIPYVRTGGEVAAEIVNPDWAYRDSPQGDIPVWWDLGARRSAFCWNTGYRQAFYDLVEKLVTRYDIDGIYFDAWKIFYRFRYPQVCYCSGCQHGFEQATGLQLPYRRDPNGYTAGERTTIDRYHDWYLQQFLEIFRETKRRIRLHKNIPLIFNLNHVRNIRNLSFTHPQIVEESDAFLYEMSRTMLERAEGTSLAVAHGLAVWPYSDAYHGYPRIPVYDLGQQQHIYATMAFGGSPTLYHTYFLVDHREARGPVREAFGTFARNAAFVRGFRPEPFCAVVWNEEDPPGHANDSWLWKCNARLCTSGAFAACLDQHVQVTSLLKDDLARPELLSKYKVLYLPDICSLTEQQLAGVRQFVEAGGGLLMTYATSRYNTDGSKRDDFALAELAQVRPVKPDDVTRDKMESTMAMGSGWDLYVKARPDQQAFHGPLANDLIPGALYEPVAVLPGGTVAADIVMGTDSEPLFPGLIVSRYGRGKVAYIPAAVDAMYRQTRIRQFADWLRQVMTYVSPEGLPYEIDAPATLIANIMSRGNTRSVTSHQLDRLQLRKPSAERLLHSAHRKRRCTIPNPCGQAGDRRQLVCCCRILAPDYRQCTARDPAEGGALSGSGDRNGVVRRQVSNRRQSWWHEDCPCAGTGR